METTADHPAEASWASEVSRVLSFAACIDFSLKASKSIDLADDNVGNGNPADLDAVIVCTAGPNHGVIQECIVKKNLDCCLSPF